jgi:hypothetical protein
VVGGAGGDSLKVCIWEEDVQVICAEHVVDPGQNGVLLIVLPSEAPTGKPGNL